MEHNKDGGTSVGFSEKWDDDLADIGEKLKIKECEHEYEPYFGWCDVEGCENEGCCGGVCWSDGGYWTVCSNHSAQHREGLAQPKMKQSSIDRENSRDSKGYLPPPIDFKIEENLSQINKQEWEDIWREWALGKDSSSTAPDFFDWLQKNYLPPVKKA